MDQAASLHYRAGRPRAFKMVCSPGGERDALKLLAQGKASHDMVVGISSALLTELNKALQTHATVSSIMQLAVEEILYIVDELFVLVEHKNSNVGAKAVAMLDKLRMKQSTTIQIFATLLFKNAFVPAGRADSTPESLCPHVLLVRDPECRRDG